MTLEQAVAELGRRGMVALKKGAMMGTLALGSVSMATTLASNMLWPATALAAVNEGSDWAQDEGVRDQSKVHFYGEAWSHVETTGQNCGERGCYGGTTTTTVWVKVRVQPQWGANLDAKNVGVVYRDSNGWQGTANGYYFTTHGDGYEEWHVPVVLSGYHNFIAFNAWYQGGAGGPTWYDDNEGELHLATVNDNYRMVSQWYADTDVMIDDAGIQGTISVRVTDIDFDKDLRLVYTTDDWATTQEIVIGDSELNAWHWVHDEYGNRERWELELELLGDYDHIEYAIVYRHGVVNGADTYEYWDNNYGNNYRVDATP
ncbi:MAG: hypothetical protein AB1Z98_38555 [Nannocystaceae bacterium]